MEMEGSGETLEVNRYLTKEEGIRAELNAWAAWLETQESQATHERLMLQVVRTEQLFSIYLPGSLAGNQRRKELCLDLCRYLARESSGVYQVDGLGFFDLDGTSLLEEWADQSGSD
jgi:hypothetical protein